MLVEAERLRPGLDQLLALADYVVTSAHFPQVRQRSRVTAEGKQDGNSPPPFSLHTIPCHMRTIK